VVLVKAIDMVSSLKYIPTKRVTVDFIVAYLTLFLVFVAADRFNVARAQEPPQSGSRTNFIEFVIERLDVYPGKGPLRLGYKGAGRLIWNGAIVYHGQETVRVQEYDVNVMALGCSRLSDAGGRIWQLEVPEGDDIVIRPPLEEYNVVLKANEKLIMHDREILGRLVLKGGPNQGTAGNTTEYPSELKYSLDLKRESADEQGHSRGFDSILFSGAGTLKVTWIKEDKTSSNGGVIKP
jgi:hypothetical protein